MVSILMGYFTIDLVAPILPIPCAEKQRLHRVNNRGFLIYGSAVTAHNMWFYGRRPFLRPEHAPRETKSEREREEARQIVEQDGFVRD